MTIYLISKIHLEFQINKQYTRWQKFPAICKKISCEDILLKISRQRCCWGCQTFSSTGKRSIQDLPGETDSIFNLCQPGCLGNIPVVFYNKLSWLLFKLSQLKGRFFVKRSVSKGFLSKRRRFFPNLLQISCRGFSDTNRGNVLLKEYRMVFRAGLRDPCTRDVARLSESVKILELQASVFLRFPKV